MEYIPFEKPLVELEKQIDQLHRQAALKAIDLGAEIGKLERQAKSLRTTMFANLSPYQIVQLSRHPLRPKSIEIIQELSSGSFVELHGDRNFYDDPAIVGGLASIDGRATVIIGHQKGRGTKENIARNFGMPKPEGYRKALRLMSLAERFGLPIITLIDTPGAYPGVGAEERGQSEAIGKNLLVMSRLKVPIICVVLGEGGSGGALALGVGNRLHMLEYSTFSVITPEGCASILLKDASQAPSMADALKMTASSALELGVINSIISEPEGGAHRSLSETAHNIKQTILEDLQDLSALSPQELQRDRSQSFAGVGRFEVLN